MNRTAVISAFALAAFAGSAMAQFSVLTVPENPLSSGLNTAIRTGPRQHQSYYHPSQLPSVTSPQTLVGLQLRLAIGENWRPATYVGSSWPDAPITFSNFEIILATGSAAVNAAGEFPSSTASFASNMSGATTVRSGSLTIPAGAFPADGGATGVHSWGFLFNFTTSYTINPGQSLVVYIRHSGYGAVGTPLNAFFASGQYAPNSRDAVANTASGTSPNAAGFSDPYFYNFVVPTPGAAAVLGLGGLVAMRRRRA